MMKRTRGLTLIELLVALAVMGVLIAVTAPSFRSLFEVQRLRGINAQLVTDLQFARNEAVARGVPLRVVFRSSASATCYALFTSAGTPLQAANALRCDCLSGPGNACNGIAGATEVRTVSVPLSQGVSIYPVDGIAAFGFDPVTGGLLTIPIDQISAPLPAFRVSSQLDSSRVFYNVLNQAGRTTVCSPAGTAMGEAPCPP